MGGVDIDVPCHSHRRTPPHLRIRYFDHSHDCFVPPMDPQYLETITLALPYHIMATWLNSIVVILGQHMIVMLQTWEQNTSMIFY